MFATLLVSIALSAAPIKADAPLDPKVEAALELVEASQFDRMFEALEPQMAKMMQDEVAQMVPCKAAAPVSEAIGKDFAALFSESVDIEKMKVDVAALYAEMFTETEIRDILVFYKSPAGAKMMEKMPELLQQSMRIGQEGTKDLQPKVAGLMRSYREDLQAAQRACSAEDEAKSGDEDEDED